MSKLTNEFTFERGVTLRNLNPYKEGLGDSFLSRVVEEWQVYSKSQPDQTEITYWSHLTMFFDYLVSAEVCKGLTQLIRGEVVCPIHEEFMLWQSCLSHYRESIERSDKESATKNGAVTGVRNFICDHLANSGDVPHGLVLQGFNIEKRLGRGTTALDQNTLTLLGESEETLRTIIASFDDDDLELDEDLKELLSNIANEINEDSNINRLEVAIEILKSRTSALRNTAAQLYVEYIKATKEAKGWLKDPVIVKAAADFDAAVSGYSGLSPVLLQAEYPRILGHKAFKVFVTWIKLHRAGRYPLCADAALYNSFNTQRVAYEISRSDIELYTGSSALHLVAAYAFILFETAGNATSIWNLNTNDLVAEDYGLYRLNWLKPRSGSHAAMSMSFQARDEELSAETLTVKDVFEHQLQCRSKFMEDVRESDKGRLFIAHYKNSTKTTAAGDRVYIPTHPSMGLRRSRFRELCELASNGRWSATPKAIRGSDLLLTALLQRDATAVAERGQHLSLAMAFRYSYELPEMLRREQNIREFLEWLEALLVVDVDDFAKKLGIDEELFEKRSKVARDIRDAEHKTALQKVLDQQFGGIHCLDPCAGVQEGTSVGEVCTKIEKCPTCSNRRGIFVLSKNNLTNIMQWHEALEMAERKLRSDSNEFKPWAIWLHFTSAILNRFGNKAEHKALFKLAEAQKLKELNPYSNIIPTVSL